MRAFEDATTGWAEPGTPHTYPLSYDAYRRAREAEERSPARHQTLGTAADRHAWERWRRPPWPQVEVCLAVRADAPPRIRRMAADILRAIRRGQSARVAIRRVSRRFGFKPAGARAWLAACLDVQTRSIPDPPGSPTAACGWPFSRPADWM